MSHSTISVIFSYYEKNDEYRTNLIYFLKYGYIKSPLIDYTIVINGPHTINFPKEYMIKIIQRENTGFDFQGYYIGILSLKKNYDYYIFINSSVRGPFMPPYMTSSMTWYQPMINLLRINNKTKLVGPTINIQSPSDTLKITRHCPHVQSYCFTIDNECLNYLMTSNLFRKYYSNKYDVIANQEIGMSTLVLQHGWNINCLIPEYQKIDYHDHNFSDSSSKIIDDILWRKNALGRIVHPYETIFFKIERDIGKDEIETLTNHYLNINDMYFIGDKNINIAICFHLGYGHMFSSFSKYIKNVYKTGYNVDLYVTYQKNTDPIHLIKQQYPNTIFIQTLRGCDTGAFLLQLERIYQSSKNYDYIFKIHTKKKEEWRFELLESIAGTTDDIVMICDNFKKNNQLGMISGSTKWIHRHDRVNDPLITDICHRIHIDINDKTFFIGGTIFWVRWSIMKKWIEENSINFKKEYDNCELGYLLNDKPTYTHSWERIYGYIVCHYNYQIVCATNLIMNPKISIDKKTNSVVKVMYGLSQKESIDVTQMIRNQSFVNLRTINTNSQWGDPYPEKRKKLFIFFKNDQIFILNECATRLSPNNFVFVTTNVCGSNEGDDLIFQLEENDNFENYIMLKNDKQLGQYTTTFFDWLYYYEKYSPWLNTRTYQECIQHYIKYGVDSNLLTFNIGESLINKYKIKLFAYYVSSYTTSMFSTNIKNWKPMCKGHQIKLPNDNYQLTETTLLGTLRKQVDLAKNNGITGFCFLHYWENGNKHAHEPAELFLSNDSISSSMLMCFSWVTETTACDRNDWTNHFSYLLPFFKNKKYLKISNQPVFLLNSMAKTNPFVLHWNQLAIDAGFRGMFFIETISHDRGDNHYFQNATQDNPSYVRSKFQKHFINKKTYTSIDYNRLCHSMINQKKLSAVYFREIFVGFDNTLNIKEKNKLICDQITPKSVYCTLKTQIENVLESPNPDGIDNLIFIHSWNDWENQMVIEIDHSSNREILNAINNVVCQYSNPQIYNKMSDLIL